MKICTGAAIAALFGFMAAAELCADDVSCQHDLATRFAPEFRLDKSSVEKERCLPGHPATVYEKRKAGYTDDICETDKSKLETVPIFYYYEECGDGVVTIDYWIWYSHQSACLQIKVGGIMNDEYGAHRADWERIGVHIRDDKIQKVRFHQHSGSYTKKRGDVDFTDSTKEHPAVYVGQDSHGCYHNQGGTGNCLYFQDFRRFEDTSLKVQGWKNLFSIQNNSQDLPEWFDADREYLDSFPPPKDLSARSGCNQKSCAGLDSWIEATEVCTGKVCGCRKSDYCEDIKFGDVSDKSPCSDTFFNDLTSKGKDLVNNLFDNAQVSRSQPANMLFALFVSLTLSMHRAWV
eukprot:symbB.v1.2.014070.t1/scaffold1007.1/size144738/15